MYSKTHIVNLKQSEKIGEIFWNYHRLPLRSRCQLHVSRSYPPRFCEDTTRIINLFSCSVSHNYIVKLSVCEAHL